MATVTDRSFSRKGAYDRLADLFLDCVGQWAGCSNTVVGASAACHQRCSIPLTVPEEIWFAGKTDHYRESLLVYLKTTECGRHPSHIVWTHGSPIAVGQLRFAAELGQLGETDLLAEQSQPAREEPLGKLSACVDHVYLAVKCTGCACDNWIFLFDMGPAEAGKGDQRKLPRRFDVTCPACNSVLTYTRADLRQVRAQEPPGDWIDHPAFGSP